MMMYRYIRKALSEFGNLEGHAPRRDAMPNVRNLQIPILVEKDKLLVKKK